jgi:hypothetical protein
VLAPDPKASVGNQVVDVEISLVSMAKEAVFTVIDLTHSPQRIKG